MVSAAYTFNRKKGIKLQEKYMKRRREVSTGINKLWRWPEAASWSGGRQQQLRDMVRKTPARSNSSDQDRAFVYQHRRKFLSGAAYRKSSGFQAR
jgi:hypothetical protein